MKTKYTIYFIVNIIVGSLLFAMNCNSQPRVVERIPIPSQIVQHIGWGLEHDSQHLWVPTIHPDSKVYKIDPKSGSIAGSYRQNHFSPGVSNVNPLAYDKRSGHLYNFVYPQGPFYLIDTSTLREVPGSLFRAPTPWIHDIAIDSDSRVLWVLTADSIKHNYQIYKIDPMDKTVKGSFTSPANAPSPAGLTWDGNYLWVSDADQYLYQIDSQQALASRNSKNAIIQKIYLPDINAPLGRLAWDGRYLWTYSVDKKFGNYFYKIDPTPLKKDDYHPICQDIAKNVSSKQNECLKIKQDLERAESLAMSREEYLRQHPDERERVRHDISRLRANLDECVKDSEKLVDLHDECSNTYRDAVREGTVRVWEVNWRLRHLKY